MITHIIQARITLASGNHQCCMCKKKAGFAFVSYEAMSEDVRAAFIARLATMTLEEQMKAHGKSALESNVTYEATLQEQQQGEPIARARGYNCFSCLSRFISDGMDIPDIGATVLSLLTSDSALWIIRDVGEPDRWGLTKTPHQDVTLLREELRTAHATLY